MIKAILKGYKWNGINDVIGTLFPSIKLGITLELISMSALIATLSNWLGLGQYTVISLGIALVAELSSGLFTSLIIRKESFESGKLGRFFFKVGLLIVVLFITYSWKRDFLTEGEFIKVEFFSFVHTTIVILSFSEILISVLENYAEIQGKPKDYYSSYVIEKINNLLKK